MDFIGSEPNPTTTMKDENQRPLQQFLGSWVTTYTHMRALEWDNKKAVVYGILLSASRWIIPGSEEHEKPNTEQAHWTSQENVMFQIQLQLSVNANRTSSIADRRGGLTWG